MSQYKAQHNLKIAEHVKASIRKGVPITLIMQQVREMPNGPRSNTTFYSVYRKDITDARVDLHTDVGSIIMEKALVDKDMQALTLVAKTKLGWNEKVLVEEVDPNDIDLDSSAIDDIIAKLNIKEKSEDESR